MNTELAKTVRELIRLHPQQHSQDNWSTNYGESPLNACGTSACIAGWVAAANGLTVDQAQWPSGQQESMVDDPKPYVPIDSYAQVQLGIDVEQADAMFMCFDNERSLRMLDLLIETDGAIDADDMEDLTAP